MIPLSRAVRTYVALEPVNMRRSFDGPMADVRSVLALDPLSGHVLRSSTAGATMLELDS